MTTIAYALPKLLAPKEMERKSCKKPFFRTPFNSQHAKGSQTLLKSSPKLFHYVFPSFRKKTELESVSIIDI